MEVIALDRPRDLVLLQVRDIAGIALALGTNGLPEVGEEIYALGNPQGLEGSISSGIISSGGIRRIEGEELIQITAPISPGSSGGPVVNRQGEVIGVAESSLRNGQNLNFAVPIAYIALLLKNTSAAVPLASVSAKSSEASNKEKPIKSGADQCGDTPYELSPSSRAEDYKFAGYEFFRAGVYDQAKEAFKRAIRLNRKDGDAYFRLAKAYSQLRCYEEAVLAHRQAIILKPKEPEYKVLLGIQLRVLGRYDEAIEVYQEGIKIKPSYSDFYQGLGAAYYSKGQPTEAIEALKNAIRLDPKNVWAHEYLGKIYAELGNKEAAFREYTILSTLDAYRAESLRKTLEHLFGPK